jgi:trehalose synthase-fused probable maltokinase
MGPDWQGALDMATRIVLERQAIVPFLKRQRWFAAKSKAIAQARFSDWTTLRGGTTPAFLATVTVDFADQTSATYAVPLSLLSGERANEALRDTPNVVLARITGARKGAIVDGFQDDDVLGRMWALVEDTRDAVTVRGTVRGERRPNRAPDADRELLPPERRWTRTSGEQSNSIAFVNDRYALKLYRRVEAGANPDYELSSLLAEQQFTRTPPLVGALLYQRPGAETATLGLAQGVVQHQGSGWDFTIDELRRYYERVAARVRRSRTIRQCERGPECSAALLSRAERWCLTRQRSAAAPPKYLALAGGSGNRRRSAPRRRPARSRRHADTRRRCPRSPAHAPVRLEQPDRAPAGRCSCRGRRCSKRSRRSARSGRAACGSASTATTISVRC